MTLSIIIVNYNVKYFLEQCLYAVSRASKEVETEVIVVDNHSTDGSLRYLVPKFPEVNFITNAVNSGFGKASNLGVGRATGEYILFLNPDTLIAEDSLVTCLEFFKAHAACGALGVKMIDGGGRFLKESKRAFPSPSTSLFKLAGLAYLFPRSKIFSRYHLGHLDKEQVQEVDVLAGAFLLTKRAVLQKVGAFDEAFFMYGEDVDLSYRIQKAGYKNYYVPQTTIIHFKGESTKRGSLNYVRMFYQAMSIFVKKHYGGARAGFFHFSIQLAIWLRAFIATVVKAIRWVGVPVLDAILILFSFYVVKEAWVKYVRPDMVYPDTLLLISFPVFTLVYVTVAYYAGLYDRHYKMGGLLRPLLMATVTLLALYALLPEHYRFSRGIVLFGALAAFVFITAQRRLLVKARVLSPPAGASAKPDILVAANGKEFSDIKKILAANGFAGRIIGRVGINGTLENVIAHISDVDTTAKALGAGELIFCARTLSYKTIIALTEKHHSSGLKFRFHAAGSTSIVGSDTSTESGETLSGETGFGLAAPSNKRIKRLIDVTASLLFLITFPVHFFLVGHPLNFFRNCFATLAGRKTWVGYITGQASLPYLRKSVLAHNGRREAAAKLPRQNTDVLDYWYARNYEPVQDVQTIFTCYRYLGAE